MDPQLSVPEQQLSTFTRIGRASRSPDPLGQIPLREVPFHYVSTTAAPHIQDFLSTILSRTPRGGAACEIALDTGYASAWLSLRGVTVYGIDDSALLAERAGQVSSIVGGNGRFTPLDPFGLDAACQAGNLPRFDVIHHADVLSRFPVPWIRALLAQHSANASWVIFTAPSVHCANDPAFGHERLLPIEEWARILEPFDIADLRYCGTDTEHILCVLRGMPRTPALEELMHVPAEPYPQGVSAIVHTRNESRHIEDCLRTLQGWTDEIIVCDMESTDDTVAITRRVLRDSEELDRSPCIVRHPLISNFDRARNVSAMRARYRWVFYLDADERVPPGLGPALRKLISAEGDSFAAMLIPFRHHFAGHWMRCLYPGYTAPRLLKNGCFHFNARLHSGAEVDGRVGRFPADNPDLALVHYSYDSLSHYLDKLNRYTDGEAANMHRDGKPFRWQSAVSHFVHDFQDYYRMGSAERDGVHGFIYSFLSAFYRFEQHAKLYEKRFNEGRLVPEELSVPQSVEEMLEYALVVARRKPLPGPPEIRIVHPTGNANTNGASSTYTSAAVVWSGPLTDPSGYGEESRELLFALNASLPSEHSVAAHPIPWSNDLADVSKEDAEVLDRLSTRTAQPGFFHITHDFGFRFQRYPQSGISIGRTLFETDRLPEDWVNACNQMDYVWVASEFNKKTFAQAGVDPKKVVVIPECINARSFLDSQPARIHLPKAERVKRVLPTESLSRLYADLSRQRGKQGAKASEPLLFLAVFDWTLHKGWDVLLKGFVEAFPREQYPDAGLVLKVWSTNGYRSEDLPAQADAFLSEHLGISLEDDPRILFVKERLSAEAMRELYRNVDCYVMPSRGEGWGRPYMEAMATGLPVIGTDWSGNTAYMDATNCYLVRCDVMSVPEAGWREIRTYKGHCWAEPDAEDLKRQMLRVYEERGEAAKIGLVAREHVTSNFGRETVGRIMADEIARITEEHRKHPVSISLPNPNSDTEEHPIAVRLEGSQFMWHSLAHVNREFALGLLDTGKVDLSLVPNEPNQFHPDLYPLFSPLSKRVFAWLQKPADVHIRHFFPPRLDKPQEGALVLIQPWEYGYLPERWIEPIRENVDEVWCYSEYVKSVYLASGIPEAKLQIVPLGVDTEVYNPSAPPFAFTDEAGARRLNAMEGNPFIFLFVGGTLDRKGIDILLEAYTKAFSAYDDVCLVVKDTGTQTVYPQNESERIRSLAADPSRPAIVYLDDDLSAHCMAGLYTAADCLVQPYRGEGFCLPALEAMACGVPPIVPQGGPTDDFVDETVGWRVKAERRPFGNGKIGEWDCAGPTWMLEVSPEDLAKTMRAVLAKREETTAKGQLAAERVAEGWTWKQTATKALERMEALTLNRTSAQPPIQAALETPGAKPSGKVRRGKQTPQQPNGQTLPGSFAVVDRRIRSGDSSKSSTPAQIAREAARVSLCMIVKNEERVLADCLQSARPFFDEVVLVDTGSTDATVDIAKGFGVKLHHFPWTDSFSEARNISLDKAGCEWVMWMDADDTLPEACGSKIRELAWLAEERTTGFMMQVHIPPAPGDYGFTIVDHVKLFRNRPEHRFEGRIHEQILEPIYRAGGRIERSNLYVVHSGYDHSPEGQMRKRERDLKLLQLDLNDRPNHPFVWFNIGMTWFHLRDFDQAVNALERCLAISKPQESTVRKVFAMLVGCHMERREWDLVKSRLDEGLSRFPNDPELLFRAGTFFREMGDFEKAEQYYVKLLTARESGHIDSLDVSMTTYKALHNLGLVCMDMGRVQDAERHWQAAVSHFPEFVPSWLGLAELFVNSKRTNEAYAIVRRLERLDAGAARHVEQRLRASGHQ